MINDTMNVISEVCETLLFKQKFKKMSFCAKIEI